MIGCRISVLPTVPFHSEFGIEGVDLGGAQPTLGLHNLGPAARDVKVVLSGDGGTYSSGAALLGASLRQPTDPGNEPGMFGAGLVPDWVAFDAGPTNKFPAAQIAVFGTNGPPTKKRYRIEACGAWALTPNGASAGSLALAQYASNFWHFDAISGTQYTVTLSVAAGDPDVYIYEDRSHEYVDADASAGGGAVTFAASDTCRHYIRVHGYSAIDSSYSLSVTSP